MVVGDPSSDSQIIVNFPESSMADTLNNVRNTASVWTNSISFSNITEKTFAAFRQNIQGLIDKGN